MREGHRAGHGGSRIQSRVNALLPQGDARQTERRGGDRRSRRQDVSAERRSGPDRRRSRPRRESALGHFYNVAQLLTLAAADPAMSADLVEGALRRLWLGMREMERGNTGQPAGAGHEW